MGSCRGFEIPNGARQTPDTLEALRQTARIESTESSNRIEGIEAPRLQVEKIVLHQATPRNRSEQEIAGYRDALALIHDSAAARVGRIVPGRGTKTKQVQDAVNRQIAPFAISEIERLCPGVGCDMIRLVLRQLRDEKLVASSGVGRSAKWRRTKRPGVCG